MKFSVLQFPGSNSDQDCVHAVRVLGHEARYLWHEESSLADCDAVLVPGGFSYGDYLRAGAIARFSLVMQAVVAFAQSGGLVLGVCNGFQILCEAGILPGALVRNRDLEFRCEQVFLRIDNRATSFTRAAPEEGVLRVPIAHGEGCFVAEESVLDQLEADGRVLWRYCDAQGGISEAANPNGSLRNIAGICNEGGNVAGLMPHPERACEKIAGSEDGRWILESMIQTLAEGGNG